MGSLHSSKLKSFEGLRLRRILRSMTYAAKTGTVFHIWWHPHNFGVNQKENIGFLIRILNHYTFLNQQYGFESVTMKELSSTLDKLRTNKWSYETDINILF